MDILSSVWADNNGLSLEIVEGDGLHGNENTR